MGSKYCNVVLCLVMIIAVGFLQFYRTDLFFIPTRPTGGVKAGPHNTKYLIYLCDEFRNCGGWGDRQRGIVAIFILSLVWKRRFGIKITTPCDVRPYYYPNEFNWIISDEEIRGKTTKTLDFMGVDEPLRDTDFNKSDVAEVLFIKTNCFFFMDIAWKYYKYLPLYLKGKGRAALFREAWNKIMIPTGRLTKQVNHVLSKGKMNDDATKSQSELVCAHIRIGQSEFLPFDHVALSLNSVPKIWTFFEKYKKSRIFIATDHQSVRKDAIVRYGKRYIGSNAVIMNPDNMRFNKTLACIGQENAYVDQLVLAQCDVLVYYGPSGFSIHATYLKLSWNNIFSFIGKDVNTVGLS